MTERSYSRRVLEVAMVVGLAVLLAVVARRIAGSFGGGLDLVPAFAGLLAGILITDFISGLVHWLCDTYGDERTRVLGPLLIAPFREHHRYPQRMLGRPFLQVNFSNGVGALGTLAVFVPLAAPSAAAPAGGGVFVHALLLSLAVTIYLTNTFHQWAHDPRPPRIGRLLQRCALSIDPRRHARHHATGYGAFCITTGWLNPPLDRLRAFPRVERVVSRLSRAA